MRSKTSQAHQQIQISRGEDLTKSGMRDKKHDLHNVKPRWSYLDHIDGLDDAGGEHAWSSTVNEGLDCMPRAAGGFLLLSHLSWSRFQAPSREREGDKERELRTVEAGRRKEEPHHINTKGSVLREGCPLFRRLLTVGLTLSLDLHRRGILQIGANQHRAGSGCLRLAPWPQISR